MFLLTFVVFSYVYSLSIDFEDYSDVLLTFVVFYSVYSLLWDYSDVSIYFCSLDSIDFEDYSDVSIDFCSLFLCS